VRPIDTKGFRNVGDGIAGCGFGQEEEGVHKI
jgi:hypothetical protein